MKRKQQLECAINLKSFKKQQQQQQQQQQRNQLELTENTITVNSIESITETCLY